MRPAKMSQFSILLGSVIFLLIFSSPTFGQSGPVSDESLKSPLAEEFNNNTLKKLQNMSPQEVEKLDKMLAEALTLFYDREYARALPVFREISEKIENMDVMFWYASCAAKAGESDLAIKKYNQMLEIAPDLHRVRLELATVYFGLGRYEDARSELNTVLDAKPPDAVKENINKLLSAIDTKTKKLFTNFRFSVGIQRDSNVNSAPDELTLYLPPGGGIGGGGGTLTLNDPRQRRLIDWVVVDSLSGNILYDLGQSKGWMWNSTGLLYQSHAQKYHEFGSSFSRVTTGPWFVKSNSIFKVPIGYAKNRHEYDSLYDTFDISPSYEYFFRRNISLKGKVTYSKDSYIPNYRWEEDNINRIIEINPNIYFNNRRDILSFFITDENLNADAPRYSYDELSFAVSYFKPLKWDMEVYGRFKYSEREYEDKVFLWPYNREDKKYNFYAVLSKNFGERYFASINYNFLKTDSNTDLYSFKKHLFGFNLGVKF
ncbi:MAG: tetratricopeptide repeat protein [Deltaproteobacteria bacterium]|nr:tetratricopeptide repeat protein [Deltaproteobacteria bacterium]